MSNLFNITSVVGTDGETPIRNPEGRFETYALKELWDGTVGEKRFIPNIGDLVADTDNTTVSPWWRVKALDANLIPTLEVWGRISAQLMDNDVLTGPGRVTNNATYRLYIDKSVTPYTLAVENRLSFKGTVCRYARIVRQVAGPGATQVISTYYDNQGNILGNDIPLELVETDSDTNKSEYCVPVCNTMEDLPNGEVVTLIAYTAEGHAASITQLIVENTSFIRHRNHAIRYVTGIELLTPFKSETDPQLILLPQNVPLQGLLLRGKVHYSDGSSREYPVDGTRFTILGMSDYLATMVGQKLPIWLKYNPLADETVYGAENPAEPFVPLKYDIRTTEARGAYNVRLACYPEWVGPLNGYSLRWFMYTSERNARYDVTEFVQHSVNSTGFQPLLYGVSQNLNVSVNLKDVNPIYENFRHAQTVQIILWRDGTEFETNWSINFESGQDPSYGVNTHGWLEMINSNYYRLNVGNDCTTVEEWLAKLYRPMKPIFAENREAGAPNPTHFRIRINAETILEKNINQWNETFETLNGLHATGNVYIEWIRKTPDTDLELGTSGMILYNSTVPLGDAIIP